MEEFLIGLEFLDLLELDIHGIKAYSGHDRSRQKSIN